MNLQDVRDVVREEMFKDSQETTPTEYCPTCEDHMPMTKMVKFREGGEEEESEVRPGPDERIFLRCMGCLGLLEVKTEKVDALPKPGSW